MQLLRYRVRNTLLAKEMNVGDTIRSKLKTEKIIYVLCIFRFSRR